MSINILYQLTSTKNLFLTIADVNTMKRREEYKNLFHFSPLYPQFLLVVCVLCKMTLFISLYLSLSLFVKNIITFKTFSYATILEPFILIQGFLYLWQRGNEM